MIVVGFQTNKRQEIPVIAIWNQDCVGSHHDQCGFIVYSLPLAQWQRIEVSNYKKSFKGPEKQKTLKRVCIYLMESLLKEEIIVQQQSSLT